jgi:hypothetical protein
MASKLEEAKQKLQLVRHSLASGYIDFDLLDELERELSASIQLINEYQDGGPLSLDIRAYRVLVFEPVSV